MEKRNARMEELWKQHEDLNRETNRLIGLATHDFDWFDLDVELAKLERTLVRHFTLEEEGGYLREVEQIAPNEKPLIQRLEQSHQALREKLRELRHLAVDKKDKEGVRGAVLDWLDLLARHEAAENRLVQITFNTDIAARD